jgi:pimeloyl-ACP methyl ester carboxylesterase
MSDSMNRRAFLGTMATTVAAAELLAVGRSVRGATAAASPATPGIHTLFSSIKQIYGGPLNVGYAETGPADGPAVVLLHGWPYDIHSFVDVAPWLGSAGYRVIVPYLRGFGTTRFLSDDTIRNGEPAAVAHDIIALMNALGIEKPILAGFDWGTRTADIIAALWPERCKALVAVSGYGSVSPAAERHPLPPAGEFAWWYQFYFATERGREGYEKYHHDFAKLIWHLASPKWNFDDATYERSAAAFENPDHVAISIPGRYAHRTVTGGVGHNLPQEAPQAFAQAVIDVDSW